MHEFQKALADTIRLVHGKAGEEWVEDFPRLAASLERDWEIRIVQPSPYTLSFNYVTPAIMKDGTNAVLKLGVPSAEIRSEEAALRHYDGQGAAKLFRSDPERGAMLMENVRPGTMLDKLDDDTEAMLIAARLMRRLWKPAPIGEEAKPFIKLEDWFKGFERLRARFGGTTGPLDSRLFALAEERYAELARTNKAPMLIHGDLHHYNILASADGERLAIDPKGVIGQPEYELGPLMTNNVPKEGAMSAIRSRVRILSEALEFDERTVLRWAFCFSVLSASWSLEDGTNGEEAMELAGLFDRLLEEGETHEVFS